MLSYIHDDRPGKEAPVRFAGLGVVIASLLARMFRHPLQPQNVEFFTFVLVADESQTRGVLRCVIVILIVIICAPVQVCLRILFDFLDVFQAGALGIACEFYDGLLITRRLFAIGRIAPIQFHDQTFSVCIAVRL